MKNLQITALANNVTQILFYGDVGKTDWCGDSIGNDALSIIQKLDAIQPDQTLDFRINSFGGSLPEGLAIRNACARHQGAINFYIDGVAMSAASVIPMIKRDNVKVIMAVNALFMIHAPSTQSFGNANELRQAADMLEKYSEAWAQNIVEKTGKPLDEIIGLLTDGKDHFYTAQEALDFGFIDQIGDAIPITASLPKNINLPESWLTSNKITATLTQEKTPMPAPTETLKTDNQPQPSTQTPTIAVEASAIETKRQAETQRQDGIKAIFAMVSPDRKNILAMQERMLFDTSITEEKARAEILAKLGENQHAVTHSVHVGETGQERFKTDAVNAILAKAGIEKVTAHNSLKGWRLERIAEECLVQANMSRSHLDRMSMISAAFTQSTSDFPVLLENAMHKTLLAAYATAPDTWSRFCAVGSVSDFRAANRYRTGSFGNLDALNELGEFKNKAIPDGEKASITASTKGNIINISRQAIINDDLSAFIGLARDLARAGKRTIEADVYALLASNPTMGDGIALFHASHGNIQSTGTVVTMAAIEDLRQKMASQKDVGGNDYLDLRPALWLGGMAQGGNARVVNTSQYDPDTANKLQRPNVVAGLFRDVIDTPRISGTDWYMFADPIEAPVIEVAFLDGNAEPYIEMQQGWGVDGAQYKVRLDYGVAAIDYRGAAKNVGA